MLLPEEKVITGFEIEIFLIYCTGWERKKNFLSIFRLKNVEWNNNGIPIRPLLLYIKRVAVFEKSMILKALFNGSDFVKICIRMSLLKTCGNDWLDKWTKELSYAHVSIIILSLSRFTNHN